MTAIFGIIQHDQHPIPPEALDAAAHKLCHHAEHGSEIWRNKNIVLGQALTRFWCSSPMDAHPLQDRERGLSLVADARIDNRAELADLLGISHSELADTPDNLLLLRAYQSWGKDCPKYLLGDFVFAVWDTHSQSLFAARDPIGIRWFYYCAGQRRFAFASDLAGLIELMDDAPLIDPRSLDEFISPYTTNYPVKHTFYKNIVKLQPGQALLIEDTRIKTWYYWQAKEIQPTSKLKDPREGIEILHSLLRESVNCRAKTVDRLGCHLSGGLDSSAITALAVATNRLSGRPDPLAFSWSPPFETIHRVAYDERDYIQRIAEHLNIPVSYCQVRPEIDFLHETSDPAILPINTLRWEHNVMESACNQNVRILLSGWGGDELAFSRGIGYPSGLLKQGRFLALLQYLKLQYGWNIKSWLNSLYAHGIYHLLPEYWQIRLPASLRRERDPRQRQINKASAQAWSKLPFRQFFKPEFYAWLEKNHTPTFEWIPPGLRASQHWYLITLLNRVESWAAWSARLGMRHAYPLLDQRVVEFALSMPEDWIFYGGKLRELGKRAIDDVLPANLFEGRDKQDRALFATLNNLDRTETRKKIIVTLAQKEMQKIPAKEWLNFQNLQQALQGNTKTVLELKKGEAVMVYGLEELTRLAFLDPRAELKQRWTNP